MALTTTSGSPEKDKYITARFSPQDLSAKAKCKLDLLQAFGMNTANPKSPRDWDSCRDLPRKKVLTLLHKSCTGWRGKK